MWLTGLPVPVPLSPKFHEKLYGVVPPLTVAVNVTDPPTVGEEGDHVKSAVSAAGAIVIVLDEVALAEFASLTVTVTVYVPFVE